MKIVFNGIERVTHEEDRMREAAYWASRTMAERVIAGWDLADNDLLQQPSVQQPGVQERGKDEPEKRTAITFRRVSRERR